jgi:hypothetical protein
MNVPWLLSYTLLALTLPTAAQSNPVPFINQPLVPASTAPGGTGFMLTVDGTGFVPSSVVNWNGSPRTTQFVSSSQLTADVPASDIASPDTAWITVSNPIPGGGISNVAFVLVTSPVSSLAFKMSEYATGNDPKGVITADFNNDGVLDLATANLIDHTISILLGNGDGTFQAQVTYVTGAANNGPLSLAVGDFNADGNLDLAAANGFPPSNTVSILLGNDDGTFQPHVDYATGAGPESVVAADFNADGNIDLATANVADNTLSILLGNGTGTFESHVDYATDASPVWMTLGDFNGDNKLDLASSNTGAYTMSVLLGNGDGTFEDHADYATFANPISVSAADLNGDGKLDLFLSGLGAGEVPGGFSVLLGNGNGTFQPHVDYLLDGAVESSLTGDFDGDGKLDLAAEITRPAGQVQILLGNGDGTYGTAMSFTTGYDPSTLAAGDFDGDGRLDAVTTNRDNTLSVLLQSPVVSLSTSNLKFGTQEVGVTSEAQTVTVTNTGSATLSIASILASGDFSQSNTCDTDVDAGASCSINVTFTPKGKNTRTGAVTITDNADPGQQVVSLTGTGTVVSLSTNQLNFGAQKVGTRSAPATATLTNKGPTRLQFRSIAITGTNAQDRSEKHVRCWHRSARELQD